MGSIEIQKGDTLRISFVSPSEYEGITVIGDETNAPDIISFEYSGIPASIPKSISGELSLLFSLFSDSIPAVIENLEKDAFTDNGDGTCQVFFFEKNISCRIIYDLSTGRVLLFEAGDDELSISLEMSDYKL